MQKLFLKTSNLGQELVAHSVHPVEPVFGAEPTVHDEYGPATGAEVRTETWEIGWLFGWLCLTSHQQQDHLETAPPFTVPCGGHEARYLHIIDATAPLLMRKWMIHCLELPDHFCM